MGFDAAWNDNNEYELWCDTCSAHHCCCLPCIRLSGTVCLFVYVAASEPENGSYTWWSQRAHRMGVLLARQSSRLGIRGRALRWVFSAAQGRGRHVPRIQRPPPRDPSRALPRRPPAAHDSGVLRRDPLNEALGAAFHCHPCRVRLNGRDRLSCTSCFRLVNGVDALLFMRDCCPWCTTGVQGSSDTPRLGAVRDELPGNRVARSPADEALMLQGWHP